MKNFIAFIFDNGFPSNAGRGGWADVVADKDGKVLSWDTKEEAVDYVSAMPLLDQTVPRIWQVVDLRTGTMVGRGEKRDSNLSRF